MEFREMKWESDLMENISDYTIWFFILFFCSEKFVTQSGSCLSYYVSNTTDYDPYIWMDDLWQYVDF